MNSMTFDRRFAVAGIALCAALLGGCATTGEATSAQAAAGKADQTALQAKQSADAAQSQAARATQTANRADQKATQAQQKADAASSNADKAMDKVAQLEQKIERMFEKTMRK
ncbi:MAG TPA: Lpp/OprI family alanine-zipper lipoprotein [Burkholderiales bacterium]|nr:Lpp/OprI family alanine-zipper lipoprotein [Burkholderiales bacterium]